MTQCEIIPFGRNEHRLKKGYRLTAEKSFEEIANQKNMIFKYRNGLGFMFYWDARTT